MSVVLVGAWNARWSIHMENTCGAGIKAHAKFGLALVIVIVIGIVMC